METVEIKDALAEQDVTINVLVLPQDGPREKRPCLVSVGIPDKQVVTRSGTFEQLWLMIDQAWAEYAEVVVPGTAVPELEVIAEAAVDEPAEAAFAYSDEDF